MALPETWEPLPDLPTTWVPVDTGLRYVSIDIGSRNFAIRVEDDTTTYLYELLDLAPLKENLTQQTMKLTKYLQHHYTIFQNANVLLVEQQRLIRKQIHNATRNMRLMQHVFTYFQIVHPHVQQIELAPTVKSAKFTGAPLRMDRDMLKEWGVGRAKEILEERGDTASLHALERSKKQDDLADVIIQLDAYRQYCKIKGLDPTADTLNSAPTNSKGKRKARAPK